MSEKAPPPSLEFTHDEVPRQPPPRAPLPRPQKPQVPKWAQWAVSIGVVAAVLAALIVYVSHHNTDDSQGQKETRTGIEESNAEAAELERQVEAPRKFNLTGGPTGISSVLRATMVVMEQRINQREAGPPLKAPRCRATTRSGSKQGYSCTVDSGDVEYDFVAVVQAPVKSLIICQRYPPTPTINVPDEPVCYP